MTASSNNNSPEGAIRFKFLKWVGTIFFGILGSTAALSGLGLLAGGIALAFGNPLNILWPLLNILAPVLTSFWLTFGGFAVAALIAVGLFLITRKIYKTLKPPVAKEKPLLKEKEKIDNNNEEKDKIIDRKNKEENGNKDGKKIEENKKIIEESGDSKNIEIKNINNNINNNINENLNINEKGNEIKSNTEENKKIIEENKEEKKEKENELDNKKKEEKDPDPKDNEGNINNKEKKLDDGNNDINNIINEEEHNSNNLNLNNNKQIINGNNQNKYEFDFMGNPSTTYEQYEQSSQGFGFEQTNDIKKVKKENKEIINNDHTIDQKENSLKEEKKEEIEEKKVEEIKEINNNSDNLNNKYEDEAKNNDSEDKKTVEKFISELFSEETINNKIKIIENKIDNDKKEKENSDEIDQNCKSKKQYVQPPIVAHEAPKPNRIFEETNAGLKSREKGNYIYDINDDGTVSGAADLLGKETIERAMEEIKAETQIEKIIRTGKHHPYVSKHYYQTNSQLFSRVPNYLRPYFVQSINRQTSKTNTQTLLRLKSKPFYPRSQTKQNVIDVKEQTGTSISNNIYDPTWLMYNLFNIIVQNKLHEDILTSEPHLKASMGLNVGKLPSIQIWNNEDISTKLENANRHHSIEQIVPIAIMSGKYKFGTSKVYFQICIDPTSRSFNLLSFILSLTDKNIPTLSWKVSRIMYDSEKSFTSLSDTILKLPATSNVNVIKNSLTHENIDKVKDGFQLYVNPIIRSFDFISRNITNIQLDTSDTKLTKKTILQLSNNDENKIKVNTGENKIETKIDEKQFNVNIDSNKKGKAINNEISQTDKSENIDSLEKSNENNTKAENINDSKGINNDSNSDEDSKLERETIKVEKPQEKGKEGTSVEEKKNNINNGINNEQAGKLVKGILDSIITCVILKISSTGGQKTNEKEIKEDDKDDKEENNNEINDNLNINKEGQSNQKKQMDDHESKEKENNIEIKKEENKIEEEEIINKSDVKLNIDQTSGKNLLSQKSSMITTTTTDPKTEIQNQLKEPLSQQSNMITTTDPKTKESFCIKYGRIVGEETTKCKPPVREGEIPHSEGGNNISRNKKEGWGCILF